MNNIAFTILLPTYNGERYLREQLNSFLSQTFTQWRCIIRDDNSDDDTNSIILEYVSKYPTKFELIVDNFGNVGVKESLNIISKFVETNFFVLSDQDDVWSVNKLERLFHVLSLHNIEPCPLLVYSDLKVVDSNLNIICDSFYQYTGNSIYSNLSSIPIFNVVPGCSMAGNEKLLNLSFPIPAESCMHDYWISIVSKFAGKSIKIDDSLVLYRQHQANQLGAKKKLSLSLRLLRRLFNIRLYIHRAKKLKYNRRYLLNLLKQRLLVNNQSVSSLDAFEIIDEASIVKKLIYIRTHKLKYSDFILFLIS